MATPPDSTDNRSLSFDPRNDSYGSNWLLGLKALSPNDVASHDSVWKVGHGGGLHSRGFRMYQYWDGSGWHRHTVP